MGSADIIDASRMSEPNLEVLPEQSPDYPDEDQKAGIEEARQKPELTAFGNRASFGRHCCL